MRMRWKKATITRSTRKAVRKYGIRALIGLYLLREKAKVTVPQRFGITL